MDELEKAIKSLADRPDFETLMEWLNNNREGYISDLSHHDPAGNPSLLSHLAGSISAIDLIIKTINECKPKRVGERAD